MFYMSPLVLVFAAIINNLFWKISKFTYFQAAIWLSPGQYGRLVRSVFWDLVYWASVRTKVKTSGRLQHQTQVWTTELLLFLFFIYFFIIICDLEQTRLMSCCVWELWKPPNCEWALLFYVLIDEHWSKNTDTVQDVSLPGEAWKWLLRVQLRS